MDKINDNNLRLTGNQIKLTMRPISSSGTASSRCALLGRSISRPVSAIPLLNLGYNEFEAYKNLSTRRPWSADNPYPKCDAIYTDGTSGDSAEELDTLPSSNLLDDLLSETLHSWRNGKRTKQSRKNKQFKKPPAKLMKRALTNHDETPSAGSDTSSSNDSIPVKPGTSQETTADNKIPNEYDESIKAMALIPGLKTKPPIPKKPDSGTPKSAKKTITPSDERNFETIANTMLNYNLSETPNKDSHIDNQSSTSTLDSSDGIRLKIQNWFQERGTSEDIEKSELNTDLSIRNLKLNQTGEKSDSESDVASPKPTKQLNDISNLGKRSHSSSPKRVNFEEFDFSDVIPIYERRKIKNSSKNFIKENIKSTSRKSKKKLNERGEDLTSGSKFTPTQMKTLPDYADTIVSDVESWMSNQKNSASYLDCLNKVDDLQESCKDIRLEGVPNYDLMDVAATNPDDGSTYDDIVAILQTLEEEDKKSQVQMETMKKIVNDELSSSETDENAKHELRIVDVPQRKQKSEEQLPRTSIKCASNLNDIFLFLDEVDQNCTKSLICAKERVSSASQLIENSLQLDTIPKLEELLEHSNTELSNYIIQLNLRLKEKSSAITLLQKELSDLRNQITKMSKDSTEIVKQKLKTQKEDYENIVKRHQKFIDQLIADKKTLNQQCEGLVHEIKMLEDRYNSNLRAAEHKHKVELQKIKEMHTAGEKMRRDRWIDTKTQKIKEMTVKGLEPELDKMTSRHQQELMDLRNLHKREIEDLDLRAARKLQQHCEALREQLTVEREKALAHERDVLRQRFEQMVAAEEQNFQEQRRRLLADHAKRISECEERENNAFCEKERGIKQAQNEFEDKLQTVIRKHNIELNLLKEKTVLEMESFRHNYKNQVALQLGEKEVQIRDKCRKERDKEIEAVIERLEMDASEIKLQTEQSYESRVRRLKEKYEKEIKDLEESEKESSAKYCDTKMKLTETEDHVLNLKAHTKQLEAQLVDLKELTGKLSNEREHVKDIIKEEMKQEIQMLEKELHELKSEKDKELQKVYARVKVAVARKDETISELNRDHTALQEKCAYLENMLEQQRKEYLIK